LPLDGEKYRYTKTGAGVQVYVLDTGIRTSHVEFAGGRRAACGIDYFPDRKYPDIPCFDRGGHGTAVAGSAGSTKFGVAKNATLISVKVGASFSSGTDLGAAVKGLHWVRSQKIRHPAQPMIAVLSFGWYEGEIGDGPNSTVTRASIAALEAATAELIAANVTVVTAAGNDAVDACTFSPGRVPGTINVGGADKNDTVWYASNYGACVDLYGAWNLVTFCPFFCFSSLLHTEQWNSQQVETKCSLSSSLLCSCCSFFRCSQPPVPSWRLWAIEMTQSIWRPTERPSVPPWWQDWPPCTWR
jgi:aqualysin 1